MVQDLRTTKYGNGNDIQQVTENSDWENANYGTWCWYNNDNSHEQPYGKLYNWYGVNDGRGLCPTAWHVPTDVEWLNLTEFLGSSSVAGGPMKEAGTAHWYSPNTGATNSSGFSGLPGGARLSDGSFSLLGSYGGWWSSTDGGIEAYYRHMLSSSDDVFFGLIDKRVGTSVRCLWD